MDGKVLVLCSEKPTINEYGDRIDENGNLLKKGEAGEWFDILDNIVPVDEHKRVINAMDLLLPIEPESMRNSDIFFVNWENIIPSDIEPLQSLISYSATTEDVPFKLLLSVKSMMQKAHVDRFIAIDKAGRRPSIDYKFQAMDDFMRLFSETLDKNMIKSVIPAFSVRDSEDEINARTKLMSAWQNFNNMRAQTEGKGKIDVSSVVRYKDFGEIYETAGREVMNLISKPYDFEDGSR